MRDVPPALMLLLSEEARAFGSDKQIAKGEWDMVVTRNVAIEPL